MANSIDLAEIASLVGDPARAAMVNALMDGRALTAGELAYLARVSPQTASLHLRKLSAANLLSRVQQGRHHYFRIASPLVATMMESIGAVAALEAPPRSRRLSPADMKLRDARMCYDHLAGRIAVAIADAMIGRNFLVLDADGGEVTPAGFGFFNTLGIDLATHRRGRRAFCRPCLDWTERRFHIAGLTGAALAHHCEERGWIRRMRDTRAVEITSPGRAALAELFGIDLPDAKKQRDTAPISSLSSPLTLQ
jgi:DNA-binding transcriptional ArsR family regulator